MNETWARGMEAALVVLQRRAVPTSVAAQPSPAGYAPYEYERIRWVAGAEGSDLSSGAREAPLATVQKAIDQLAPLYGNASSFADERVIVVERPGQYLGALTFPPGRWTLLLAQGVELDDVTFVVDDAAKGSAPPATQAHKLSVVSMGAVMGSFSDFPALGHTGRVGNIVVQNDTAAAGSTRTLLHLQGITCGDIDGPASVSVGGGAHVHAVFARIGDLNADGWTATLQHSRVAAACIVGRFEWTSHTEFTGDVDQSDVAVPGAERAATLVACTIAGQLANSAEAFRVDSMTMEALRDSATATLAAGTAIAVLDDSTEKQVWYVGKGGHDTWSTGSRRWPYLTLTKACSVAFATPTTQAEYETGGEVRIIGQGTFTENVTVAGRARVRFFAESEAVSWAGSCTLDLKGSYKFGSTVQPQLLFGSTMAKADFVRGPSIGTAGGDAIVLLNDVADPNTSVFRLTLEGWRVAASTSVIRDANANIPDFSTAQIRGAALGVLTIPTMTISQSQSNNYSGAISAKIFGDDEGSALPTSITVTTAPSAANDRGLRGCRWTAQPTWTGPAASFLLDGNTNRSFKAQAGILAGGATKVIADDLVA